MKKLFCYLPNFYSLLHLQLIIYHISLHPCSLVSWHIVVFFWILSVKKQPVQNCFSFMFSSFLCYYNHIRTTVWWLMTNVWWLYSVLFSFHDLAGPEEILREEWGHFYYLLLYNSPRKYSILCQNSTANVTDSSFLPLQVIII